MKLYNLQEQRIEDLEYVRNKEGAILYTSFFDKVQAKSLGYLIVVEEPLPALESEFKKIVQVKEIKDDTYSIFYKIEDKTLEELILLFKERTQQFLDEKAIAKGYDNILSACSYAGFDNPFRAEGEKFGKWRSEVWSKGYAILKDITEGRRKLPKSFKEILDELPILEEI